MSTMMYPVLLILILSALGAYAAAQPTSAFCLLDAEYSFLKDDERIAVTKHRSSKLESTSSITKRA